MKIKKIKGKKYLISLTVFILSVLTLSSCSKGGGGGGGTPTPPVEAPITFTMNPDPGTSIFAALASTQDFTISVTSKMPAAGVKVDLSLTKDIDGSSVFSQSLTSATASSLTATYQNLTSGLVCTGTIKVTSASSASNSASKTFKIAKK